MNETIKMTMPPLKGDPCPACYGFGRHNDGFFGISATNQDGSQVFEYRPSTRCETCHGKGRVKITVTPLDEVKPCQSS